MNPQALRVSATAPAKTNLALHVGAPTPDGYHPLETLFVAVDVRETVTATLSNTRGITVTVAPAPGSPYERMIDRGRARLSDIPLDGSNLAVRAALAVCDAYGQHPGLALHIHKAVPVAGGMAGGSADAAAALVAVDALLARSLGTAELGRDRLMELGTQLGADVPFTVLGGLALGRGRGDRLESFPTETPMHLVFVPQDRGLSTPEVFRRWDRAHAVNAHTANTPGQDVPRNITPTHGTPHPVQLALVRAAASGDVHVLPTMIRNDLQAPALELLPELGSLLGQGKERGALAGWVSGSGPTVCFLAASATGAEELARGLEGEGCPAFATTAPVGGAQVLTE